MDDDRPVDMTEILNFTSTLPLAETLRVVGELLAVDLVERVNRQGVTRYGGDDDAGVEWVKVRGDLPIPSFVGEVEVRRSPPSVEVHTVDRGDDIVASFAGVGVVLSFRRRPGPKIARERAEWRRALDGLRAEGWEAELTCPAAPVQVEGRVPSGEEFYFRSRHDRCSLGIGGVDPVDQADWDGERSDDGASYLTPDETVAHLRELHAEWVSRA